MGSKIGDNIFLMNRIRKIITQIWKMILILLYFLHMTIIINNKIIDYSELINFFKLGQEVG